MSVSQEQRILAPPPAGTVQLSLAKERYSRAYVHAVAAAARCQTKQEEPDVAGVDLTIQIDCPDYPEVEVVGLDLQLKATAQNVLRDGHLAFRLKASDYDQLRREKVGNARILVVVLVPRRCDEWLDLDEDRLALRKCAYWMSLRGAPALSPGTEKTTVRVPRANMFDVVGLLSILQRVGHGGLP